MSGFTMKKRIAGRLREIAQWLDKAPTPLHMVGLDEIRPGDVVVVARYADKENPITKMTKIDSNAQTGVEIFYKSV